MRFNRKRLNFVLIPVSAVAVIALVLRFYTYWVELDLPTGFFERTAIACLIFNIFGFIVFALCLLLSLSKSGRDTEKNNKSMPPDEADLLVHNPELPEAEQDYPEYFLQGFARKSAVWRGTLSSFASFLPGFGFLSYALSFFAEGALKAVSGSWFTASLSHLQDPYHLIFALLSFASGFYFLIYALKNTPERDKIRPFFALAPAFWCTLRLVIEYRDLTRFLNKELYIGQFLFIISAMVFFLYQAQLLFGEKPLYRPNSYAFSALAAAYFGITARFPQLIAAFGDRISLDIVDSATLFIDLAITLYIVVKLISVTKKSNSFS